MGRGVSVSGSRLVHMFEMMDPSDEAEVWADFVPPVPPADDDIIDVDELDEGDPEAPDDNDLVPIHEVAAHAMADFEASLEQSRLDGLDADGTLAEAAGTKQAERRVQAKQLWLALHWADLHAVLARPGATGRGRERLVRLGGDGTPEVAEFAPAELGAVLGRTDGAAKSLIGDGLDLRHRFPLLWRRVQDGWVEVWLARRIVQEARPLTRGGCGGGGCADRGPGRGVDVAAVEDHCRCGDPGGGPGEGCR